MNSTEKNPQQVGGGSSYTPFPSLFFAKNRSNTFCSLFLKHFFFKNIFRQTVFETFPYFVQGVANINKPVAAPAMLCSPSPIQPQATGPATSRWSDYSTTFNSLRPPESSILTPFMGSIHSKKLKLLLTFLISKFPLLSNVIKIARVDIVVTVSSQIAAITIARLSVALVSTCPPSLSDHF